MTPKGRAYGKELKWIRIFSLTIKDMDMRNKTSTILVFALILAALVGCGGSSSDGPASRETSSADEEATLRLAYRPKALADVTPVVFEQQEISIEGVNVKLIPVSSPPVAFSKYRAGEIDAIAGMPLESVFKQIEGGERPFQAYYLQVDKEGEGWVSLIGSGEMGISSIEDLRRKDIMSLPTNQAKYLLRRILISGGLEAGEFTIREYNPSTPLLALRSGAGAALFGLEPAISKAVAEGHNIVARGPVSKFLFDGKPVPVSASIVSKSFIDSNPEAYKSFVQTMEKAAQYVEAHPDSVRRYFQRTKYGGLDPSITERLSLPVMVRPNSSLEKTGRAFVRDLIDEGILSGSPETYFSPLFPDRAVGTGQATATR